MTDRATDCEITVAGGGGFGTALAHLLIINGHRCRLWVRDPKTCEDINSRHQNSRYLPGHTLSQDLVCSTDPKLLQAPILVCAIPCQSLRAFLAENARHFSGDPILVSVAKGLEIATQYTCSQIIAEEVLWPYSYAILSGPSFATDVVSGHATAVSLACADADLGRSLCRLFSNKRFRAYYTSDVKGVELGGALKNVIAIACGICDALNMGPNARAALLTRALAEMARLGVALGAEETTFMGLSGLGDLILTSTCDTSRNRRTGLGLGRGEALSSVLASLGGVAEGVPTSAAVAALVERYGVDAPIFSAVYAVCHKGASIAREVETLFSRDLRDERRV